MSLISAERTITAGPPVEIDCPACHARQVSAIPSLYEERPVLLHLIPLLHPSFPLHLSLPWRSACRMQ